MQASHRTTCRALRDLALVAAASLAAASIWASGLPQQAWLVDASLWLQEMEAPASNWPRDGWYRIVPGDRAVEVRAVHPREAPEVRPDALFLRAPGTALPQGARPLYRHAAVLQPPRLGEEYEMKLGRTPFSLRVDNVAKGMRYAIGYGGQVYTYVLGPFDAVHTGVRAVADLDGDAQPDFLVDVDEVTYLLLSTRARPGPNLPAAELQALAEDGC